MIDLEFVGDYRNPQQLTARQRELGYDGTSDGDFTFDDFIDIINPLQHIPVVSTLYREITGDEISPHARIFGGTLFGGPSGFLSAAANTLFNEIAGGDVGETLIAFVTGDDGAGDPQFAETGGVAGSAAALSEAAPLETSARQDALPAPGAPPSAGMLTGQAALDALFRDLGGGAAPAAAPDDAVAAGQTGLPLPGRQAAAGMRLYPLPPRPPHPATPASAPPENAKTEDAKPEESPVSHPLLFAQGAGEAGIAERMMQALDKYRAMSRQRHDEPQEKRGDDARWQVDPLSGAVAN